MIVICKSYIKCCFKSNLRLIFIRNFLIPDIEELHEAAIEIVFGFSCLTFAGEGYLPVFDVGQGAF